MSRRRALDDRLHALERARALGEGRIADADAEALDAIVRSAAERRARSSEHTVVGFFGATGSGKSSLFNAVVGEPLARTHVTRPTTSEPLAAVWRPEGAAELLDWLEVRDRRTPAPFAGDDSLPLILLDLPDFDSVALEHREIATRLAGQVDVLVWVVDPQKYADATLHRDFIAPLAEHAAVTAVVLNQIDLLPRAEVPAVVRSLTELVRADGLGRVRVLPASAVTGEGVDEVRALIARFARDRAAASARLEADARGAARRLLAGGADAEAGSGGLVIAGAEASGRDAQRLVRDVGAASGIDTVAQAVAASYRKRAGQATGWPLTSWLLRLRPDPLRRLRLGDTTRAAERRGRDAELHRTSLPPLSAGQRAGIGRAVRDYVDRAAEGLPDGWQAALRARSADSIEALPDELDRAIARTDLGARGSWWWAVIAIVQWVALLAAIVGVGWYLAVWALPLLGLPPLEITLVEGWPVPGLLIALGALLGILLGLVVAAVSGAVAAGRRRRARRRMLREIDGVVRTQVVEPVAAERERAREFVAALEVAAG
ncbi:MAG: ABC transporter [Microbacteriaceae bacterium]|nr:ABC transporter [Microbacteriaceae bacterium]